MKEKRLKCLKYCSLVILLILIGQTIAHALDLPSLPNKPVDFWGMKWGDSPDKLGNDKVLFKKNQKLHGEAYDIKRNNISFEGFQVSKVHYVFYYKKLTRVTITINHENADYIYTRIKKRFGKPVPIWERELVKYVWMDNEIIIVLKIPVKSFPTLEFGNRELLQEMFPQFNID
jgi:hypothetical protein